jgi:hypothetical protein
MLHIFFLIYTLADISTKNWIFSSFYFLLHFFLSISLLRNRNIFIISLLVGDFYFYLKIILFYFIFVNRDGTREEHQKAKLHGRSNNFRLNSSTNMTR